MKILILSPHTDDAELGAGGSIARFIEEKQDLMWIVFSTAEESLPKKFPKNTLRTEFKKVTKKYNVSNFKIFNFKVRYLFQHRQKILETLVSIRDMYKPDLVITTSRFDKHQDHIVITEETIRAFKNSASIIGYELPWNHLEFSNSLYIKLKSRHIEKKIEILQEYKSQTVQNKPYLKNDYIRSLARIRGMQISNMYAESFEIIKWIM